MQDLKFKVIDLGELEIKEDSFNQFFVRYSNYSLINIFVYMMIFCSYNKFVVNFDKFIFWNLLDRYRMFEVIE